MQDFSAIYLVYLWVGAGVGATGRWLLSEFFSKASQDIAAGTLLANLTGAFLIGLLFHLSQTKGWSTEIRLAVLVGGLGSLTTFSTFSLEGWQLITENQWLWFIAHSLLHFLGCLLMVCFGTWVARMA